MLSHKNPLCALCVLCGQSYRNLTHARKTPPPNRSGTLPATPPSRGHCRPPRGRRDRAVHRPLSERAHRRTRRSPDRQHPRPHAGTRGTRQAPRIDPLLARGTQTPHRGIEGQNRRGQKPLYPRGPLPPVPPEKAHPRDDGQGKRPRAARRHSLGAKLKHRSRDRSRPVCQCRKRSPRHRRRPRRSARHPRRAHQRLRRGPRRAARSLPQQSHPQIQSRL